MTSSLLLVLFSQFVLLTPLTIAYNDSHLEAYIRSVGADVNKSNDSRSDNSTMQQKQKLGFLDALAATTNNNNNTSSNQFDNHVWEGILQIPYSGLITRGITPVLAERLGLDTSFRGDVIIEVMPGSPAENLGISTLNMSRTGSVEEVIASRGDIILKVDGSTSFTTDYRTFEEYVFDNKMVGDNITLSILRNGQLSDIEMTLAQKSMYLWYEDTDEGIGINYPPDWAVLKYPAEGLVVQFHSPEKTALTDLPVVNVSLFKYTSVRDSNSGTLDPTGNDITIFRLLDFNVTRLGNSSGYISIYYDYSQNTGTQKVLTVFTERDSSIYGLNFRIDPNKYADYRAIINEMIKSFQFV